MIEGAGGADVPKALFCRFDNILFADTMHQVQAPCLPAAVIDPVRLIKGIALPQAVRAGTVRKKEVVNDKLIEMFSDKRGDFSEPGAHLRIAVTKRSVVLLSIRLISISSFLQRFFNSTAFLQFYRETGTLSPGIISPS